jgi:hypothetical protein
MADLEAFMAVYTVYQPPLRAGDSESDPARFAFVRDGFYWSAFFFAVLWMLWHRLWLALIGYLVVAALLAGGVKLVGGSTTASVVVGLLLALLVGIEASSLRRWTLARRGWKPLGVVVADDFELAERRFFDAWIAEGAGVLPLPPAAASGRTGGTARSDVIGLFPQPGARP